MTNEHPNDLLHGVTLEMIQPRLVERYGWKELSQRIQIRCFYLVQCIGLAGLMLLASGCRLQKTTAPAATEGRQSTNVALDKAHITSIFREQIDGAGNSTYRADLYIDGQFFGSLPTNDAGWCDRSADGFWLAYLDKEAPDAEVADRLRWVDLRNLEIKSRVPELPGQSIQAPIRWSPQSLQIAFVTCDWEAKVCYLSVLDTQKHTQLMLTGLEMGESRHLDFLWKPDGTQIAIRYGDWEEKITYLATKEPQIFSYQKLRIISVDNGASVYEGQFDFLAWQADADSPYRSWGVSFPKGESAGFTRCHEGR